MISAPLDHFLLVETQHVDADSHLCSAAGTFTAGQWADQKVQKIAFLLVIYVALDVFFPFPHPHSLLPCVTALLACFFGNSSCKDGKEQL